MRNSRIGSQLETSAFARLAAGRSLRRNLFSSACGPTLRLAVLLSVRQSRRYVRRRGGRQTDSQPRQRFGTLRPASCGAIVKPSWESTACFAPRPSASGGRCSGNRAPSCPQTACSCPRNSPGTPGNGARAAPGEANRALSRFPPSTRRHGRLLPRNRLFNER